MQAESGIRVAAASALEMAMARYPRLLIPAAAALLAIAGCAGDGQVRSASSVRSFGEYRYVGEQFGGPIPLQQSFGGLGGDRLDPWLVYTAAGRQILYFRGSVGTYNVISSSQAATVNRWFRETADANKDRELTDEEIREALQRVLLEYTLAAGRHNPHKVVCKTVTRTDSRLHASRVCLTRAQWAAIAEEANNTARDELLNGLPRTYGGGGPQ